MIGKYDKAIAAVFGICTVVFIGVSMTNEPFFNWIFERHHNQLSWYIRPLFLVPFCYFAYKRTWAGVSVTIFCMLTSMFWFSKPEIVSNNIILFLQFEKNWLYSEWTFVKLLQLVTIPLSLFALGMAFWKRSLIMGIGIMVLIATGKTIWSLYNAGEAGKSIIIPAVCGLIISVGIMAYGYKKLAK